MIRGDAGIGKTALWRWGVEQHRAAGHRVLVTRPAEEELHGPMTGLLDLFEDAGPAPGTLDPDADVFDRGRAVLRTLRPARERRRRSSVAIDDIQWLDAISARALRYAFRRLDREPVVLLATRTSAAATDGRGRRAGRSGRAARARARCRSTRSATSCARSSARSPGPRWSGSTSCPAATRCTRSNWPGPPSRRPTRSAPPPRRRCAACSRRGSPTRPGSPRRSPHRRRPRPGADRRPGATPVHDPGAATADLRRRRRGAARGRRRRRRPLHPPTARLGRARRHQSARAHGAARPPRRRRRPIATPGPATSPCPAASPTRPSPPSWSRPPTGPRRRGAAAVAAELARHSLRVTPRRRRVEARPGGRWPGISYRAAAGETATATGDDRRPARSPRAGPGPRRGDHAAGLPRHRSWRGVPHPRPRRVRRRRGLAGPGPRPARVAARACTAASSNGASSSAARPWPSPSSTTTRCSRCSPPARCRRCR